MPAIDVLVIVDKIEQFFRFRAVFEPTTSLPVNNQYDRSVTFTVTYIILYNKKG